MSLLEKYNNFVKICYDTTVESFLFCNKSHLVRPLDVIFSLNRSEPPHHMLDLCINNHISYLTCITYKSESVARKHVCGTFPVMIGSELDRVLCINRFNDYKIDEKLIKLFIIDGALTVIPFLMTNRKEMGHVPKNTENDVFVLFVYDKDGRGNKITMGADHAVTFRDKKGDDTFGVFNQNNLAVASKHLNLENISAAFLRLHNLKITIDSLENKLILSPIDIFKMLIQLAMRYPDKATEYITKGYIEKFASSTIAFREGKKPKFNGDSSGSFNFRKLQPNQVTREGSERIIIRPIPQNVTRSIITETAFFTCLVEKNVSIDSFNRTMVQLNNVELCDNFCLDQVIEQLLDKNYIRPSIDVYDDKEIILLVNGGLLTKYSVIVDFDTMFFGVKKICQFVEVMYFDNICMLNQTAGLPFIKIPCNDTFVSPFELNRYFKNDKSLEQLELFGPNCTPEMVEMAQYANYTKLMTGVNFHRSRYGGTKGMPLFDYTSENRCVYIHDGERFDTENETVKMDTIFSSHPQITADSYIQSTESTFDSTVLHRSRFEMDIPPNLTMEFYNVKSSDCMIDYDKLGNPIRKYLCVAKFKKLGDDLSLRIFPQTKFFVSKIQYSAGYIYYLFKLFDERMALEGEFDIKILAIKNLEKKRKRLYYDFTISCKQDFIDGTKLSDLSSQKGLATLQTTERFDDIIGSRPHVVGSLFSILGRTPYMQLKMINRKRKFSKQLPQVLYGTYGFDVLKNQSGAMKSFAPLKIDQYSSKVLISNNLYLTTFGMYQRTYKAAERNTFLPKDRKNTISVVNALKFGICFKDEYDNSITEFNVNQFKNKEREGGCGESECKIKCPTSRILSKQSSLSKTKATRALKSRK